MAESRLMLRFYTLTDYEAEERWLREMAREGWRLNHMTVPCFYRFVRAAPEDVVYKLDFRQLAGEDRGAFLQLYRDYGWEYIQDVNSFSYFRKPAADTRPEDLEIFSDPESRLDMLKRIFRFRMIPLLAIFLGCVIPNSLRAAEGKLGVTMAVVWAVLFGLYVYIFVHCARGFNRLYRKYRDMEP